jgi:hypothetical protein
VWNAKRFPDWSEVWGGASFPLNWVLDTPPNPVVKQTRTCDNKDTYTYFEHIVRLPKKKWCGVQKTTRLISGEWFVGSFPKLNTWKMYSFTPKPQNIIDIRLPVIKLLIRIVTFLFGNPLLRVTEKKVWLPKKKVMRFIWLYIVFYAEIVTEMKFWGIFASIHQFLTLYVTWVNNYATMKKSYFQFLRSPITIFFKLSSSFTCNTCKAKK